MADIVSKILVRQGTDAQRRTANSGGIIFTSGEPAYCTDTKRMFIGDGSTKGGIPVGSKNLGMVNTLFGGNSNGLSTEANNLFNNQGGSIGDFVYDRATRNIYSLSSVSNFPPNASDLAKYDSVVVVNTDQFQLNGSILNIKTGGIRKEQLAFDVCDQLSIEKTNFNQPLRIKVNGVQNYHLAQSPGYTIKGNDQGSQGDIQDIFVPQNFVIGRTSTSTLTAIPFSSVVTSGLNGQNGIAVDGSTALLNPLYFNISPDPIRRTVFVAPASAHSDFFVNGNTTLKATILNGPLTINTGTFTNNGTTLLNGNTTAGILRVNNELVTPAISAESTITIKNSISVQGNITASGTNTIGGISNFTGKVNANGGFEASGGSTLNGTVTVNGNINCTGDIVDFYVPSDLNLKSDLVKIENSLEKINSINGYKFRFNDNAPEHLRGKSSVGLIAQEVEYVLPEAVKKRGDGYKGLDYDAVISLLVESVKELNKKILKLENEVRQSN